MSVKEGIYTFNNGLSDISVDTMAFNVAIEEGGKAHVTMNAYDRRPLGFIDVLRHNVTFLTV